LQIVSAIAKADATAKPWNIAAGYLGDPGGNFGGSGLHESKCQNSSFASNQLAYFWIRK
jgi:hypothetical protein